MYIKEVKMKNFKYFENCTVTLSKGINIIKGASCSGKSTIIDAIKFIIDPNYVKHSENINLNNLIHRKGTEFSNNNGYVELIFFSCPIEIMLFSARREFSDLTTIKINNKKISILDFHDILSQHNFLPNSFMPYHFDSPILYQTNNNSQLFDNLNHFISQQSKATSEINAICESLQTKFSNKLNRIKDHITYFNSTISDGIGALNRHLKSLKIFNDYILDLVIKKNSFQVFQNQLNIHTYLSETLIDQLELNENQLIEFERILSDVHLKMGRTTFTDLIQVVKFQLELITTAIDTVDVILKMDIASIVKYPMELEAQEQFIGHLWQLRKDMRNKPLTAESLKLDIPRFEVIVQNQNSETSVINGSIQLSIDKLNELKTNIVDNILPLLEQGGSNQNAMPMPFKSGINCFLNERIFYLKMKLSLCYNYPQSILNGLQLGAKYTLSHKITPVFYYIVFKEDYEIKHYFYEYLKSGLDWLIIDSNNLDFIPSNLTNCITTWIPKNSIHIQKGLKRKLNAEFQYIWDGIDWDILANIDLNTNKTVLKFIFLQLQKQRNNDFCCLSSDQQQPTDISDLCDSLLHFYENSIEEHKLATYANFYVTQSCIPDTFFDYKKQFDPVVSIINELPRNFINLMRASKIKAKHQQLIMFHERDLHIKFNPSRYKRCLKQIEKFKNKIDQLNDVNRSLVETTNVLSELYSTDEECTIVSDPSRCFEEFDAWQHMDNFLKNQFVRSKFESESNSLIVSELQKILKKHPKPFLTDDVDFGRLINKNTKPSAENQTLTIKSFNNTVKRVLPFIQFAQKTRCEIGKNLILFKEHTSLNFLYDAFIPLRITIYEQLNKSIEITNKCLEKFNKRIIIQFDDYKKDSDNFTCKCGDILQGLNSFELFVCNTMDSNLEQYEILTGSELQLSKFMLVFGIALHNNYKLLTFDNISIIIEKWGDIIGFLAKIEEINDRQIILACTTESLSRNGKMALDQISAISNHNEYTINIIDTDIIN